MDTGDFVYACYAGILGREPSQNELEESKRNLECGVTPLEYLSYFIGSEEFKKKMFSSLLGSDAFPQEALVSLGIQNTDITNDNEFMALFEKCKPFTLTSLQNLYALYKAVEYLVRRAIAGDIVECGVWRGGSSMLAAHSFMHFGDKSRTLYLYDTYTGMAPASEHDVRFDGARATELWSQLGPNNWWPASLDEVQINLLNTGYPADRIVFVEGRVEDTIPRIAPNSIALLRLDTDWYESTMHELTHLFPLLSISGVVILDDYGWWSGSKKAADEYFQATKSNILLNRIDLGGARLGIKL